MERLSKSMLTLLDLFELLFSKETVSFFLFFVCEIRNGVPDDIEVGLPVEPQELEVLRILVLVGTKMFFCGEILKLRAV